MNHNHTHRPSGTVISGSSDGYLTVGDLRDAIADYPDDARVYFGICECGEPMQFYRFKDRGPQAIAIEFS